MATQLWLLRAEGVGRSCASVPPGMWPPGWQPAAGLSSLTLLFAGMKAAFSAQLVMSPTCLLYNCACNSCCLPGTQPGIQVCVSEAAVRPDGLHVCRETEKKNNKVEAAGRKGGEKEKCTRCLNRGPWQRARKDGLPPSPAVACRGKRVFRRCSVCLLCLWSAPSFQSCATSMKTGAVPRVATSLIMPPRCCHGKFTPSVCGSLFSMPSGWSPASQAPALSGGCAHRGWDLAAATAGDRVASESLIVMRVNENRRASCCVSSKEATRAPAQRPRAPQSVSRPLQRGFLLQRNAEPPGVSLQG